ncbi:MAG: hypothetical protein Q8L23_15895 [Caulobacter sp.]|nr:hypothetical protein [Caulobacter sp.]
MNPAHAALVAATLREKRFVDVEVRAMSSDAWRTVRGEEGRGSGRQSFEGFATGFVEDQDVVTLMVEDFPDGRPVEGWQVRFQDLVTLEYRVRPISGSVETGDKAGLLLRAPLGPVL